MGQELSGWKQIAAHLQVTVRTAQMWERNRGLPVHRLPGAKRSTVHALPEELDAWLRSSPTPANGSAGGRRRLRHRRVVFGVALLGTVVIMVLLIWPRPRSAHAYRIDGNTVVVLDEAGEVLWKKTFRGGRIDAAASVGAVAVQVADLDGDGEGEVLVVKPPDKRAAELVCFSSSGEQLWTYTVQRTVRTAGEVFEPPFNVQTVAVEPGGARRVAVTVVHQMYFPTQVALLDARGKLLREYWHSGYLTVLHFADLNHDGQYELYAGGVSNASREGTLVVLDPDTMGGASAEPAPYQLLGFPPGTELGRVFFPHGRLSELFAQQNSVIRIRFSKNQIIVETVEYHRGPEVGTVLYQLSPMLDLVAAGAGDALVMLADQLFRAGKIDRPWSEEDDEALRHIRVIKPPQEPIGERTVSLRREH